MAYLSTTGAPWLPFPGDPVVLPSYNASVDIIRSSSSRRNMWNPCTHMSQSTVLSNATVNLLRGYISSNVYYAWEPAYVSSLWDLQHWHDAYDVHGTAFGRSVQPFYGIQPVLVTGELTTEGFKPFVLPDRQGLVDRSFDAMMPGIKSDLSAVNSVYELKDFMTVKRSCQKIRTLWGTLLGLYREVLFRLRNFNRPLRQILRTAGDSYLQVKFNFEPLIREIMLLRNLLPRLANELKELQKRANVPQKRHYTAQLSAVFEGGSESLSVFKPTFFSQVGTLSAHRSWSYPVRTFNATMEYSYSLPSLSELEFQLRGFLDMIGVRPDPSIIWNALPWSFVIDWFAGIGQWLERFKGANIEPRLVIRNYCHSFKVERLSKTYYYVDAAQYHVATGKEKLYDRQIGLNAHSKSSLLHTVQTSGLSIHEGLLSAALALSRT